MAEIVFDDKAKIPEENELLDAFGPAAKYWKELKKHLKEEYGPVIEEWKFYSKKSGWTLKILKKKRNLFFFTPAKGFFKIAFVFGDKAVAVVEKSDLPEEIITTLKNARKYMEGRGLQIEVNGTEDIENVKKLVEIKINN